MPGLIQHSLAVSSFWDVFRVASHRVPTAQEEKLVLNGESQPQSLPLTQSMILKRQPGPGTTLKAGASRGA